MAPKPTEPPAGYRTPAEAAALTGCDISTILRRAKAGRIPGARRLGELGRWIIPVSYTGADELEQAS